jgi:hypothetical protein
MTVARARLKAEALAEAGRRVEIADREDRLIDPSSGGCHVRAPRRRPTSSAALAEATTAPAR